MADTVFFTNKEGNTLLERFRRILRKAKTFDILVGYFYWTGFHNVSTEMQALDNIRILVGMRADEAVHKLNAQAKIEDNSTPKGERNKVIAALINEVQDSEEQKEITESIQAFLGLMQAGRLEMRMYKQGQLHAKVYISHYKDTDQIAGCVITGSSNFSASGLKENQEFNVELRGPGDLKYAVEHYNALWDDAIPLEHEELKKVEEQTWINSNIPPYHLYLKLLHSYFGASSTAGAKTDMPQGRDDLEYQRAGVVDALEKIEAYNGVILSDVVGLGKTVLAARLFQALGEGVLVVCPPTLKDYWEKELNLFEVKNKVISIGNLNEDLKNFDYKYVLVDEAHRFRNDASARYDDLYHLCQDSKVVLVTATPLSNKIEDLKSLIDLFCKDEDNEILGNMSLDIFFDQASNKLKKMRKEADEQGLEYKKKAKKMLDAVREKVLKHLMLRRTRSDIKKSYPADVKNHAFPEILKPNRVEYTFDEKTKDVFDATIRLLTKLRYARYTPKLHLKKKEDSSKAQEGNLKGFMKTLLLKRLESSFYAFKQSVNRFITSHEKFLEEYDNGYVLVSASVEGIEDKGDAVDEGVEQAVKKGKETPAEDFKPSLYNEVSEDCENLKEIQKLWSSHNEDPKLDKCVHIIENELSHSKLILFTEAKETGDCIYEALNEKFPNEVILYSSNEGKYNEKNLSSKPAMKKIEEAFDPMKEGNSTPIRILVTTEVLAEGVNLHRSNVVINYDLPWNPTRVLQRVGRVNRLGTKHDKIHIYNFFPTRPHQSNLPLEDYVRYKVDMFYQVLGEDAHYLLNEQAETKEIFDKGKRIKEALKEMFEQAQSTPKEEDSNPELEYRTKMDQAFKSDPTLEATIEKLPQKISSGFQKKDKAAQVVTFFKKGRYKTFYKIIGGEKPKEMSFVEAAKALECAPDTPLANRPSGFYDLLKYNKQKFWYELQKVQAKPKHSQKLIQVINIVGIVIQKRSLGAIQIKELEQVQSYLRTHVPQKKIIDNILAYTEQHGHIAVLVAFKKYYPNSLKPVEENLEEKTEKEPKTILSGYITP